MPALSPDPETRRLGDALAALRRERGLSQAEAGARAGMTSQGWGLYEAGRRPGLFRPDVQRRLTAALDASPEDLALKLALLAPPAETAAADGVQARGGTFAGAPAPKRQRLRLEDDALAPWASAGVVLEYELGRWPRLGQGCVLETGDGGLTAGLFDGADEAAVFVRDTVAAPRAPKRIERQSLSRVSAVVARLDS